MIKRLSAVILFVCGCGTSGGPQVVDGGLVNPDGWPARSQQEQLRCPAGTDLLDETLSDGRRTISCKSVGSPVPKGFVMTWYASGDLALQSEFDDVGRPVARRSWDSAGRLELDETYVDGLLNSRVSYYPTGKIREEANRSRDGVSIRRLQPDGAVEAEGVIRGEVRVGEWTEWDGSATEIASYNDGLKSGRASRTYLDGSKETGDYLSGKREGRWTRKDDHDSPMVEAGYVAGELDGRYLQFYPTGQLKKELTYKAAKKHGMARYYWPSGDTEREGAYECDLENGPWTFFHDDGSKKSEGLFVTGRRAGLWKEYSPARDVANVVDHGAQEAAPCE